jgi:hypothetical protein
MKRLIGVLLLANFILFNSCQKEVSNETSKEVSQGSLQSDISGDCLPKTVAGVYEEGVVLTSANFIEIQVDVANTGSYVITTDSLNGMSFRGTGTFTATGLNTVKLLGKGTPLLAGIQNFTVTYDSTVCIISVSTLPPGGAVPATFTLGGAPNACTGAVLSGDYVVGTPMSIANTVNITINVTVIGTFNITSTSSNGIQFAASGSIGTLGTQIITLTATGTPLAAGNTILQLNGGSSTCNITVTVTATAALSDYFPRTVNSNWSYQFNDVVNDSIYRKVIAPTFTALGNPFNIFMATEDAANGFDSSGYYRKTGGSYYEFIDMGTLWGLGNPLWVEYIFLKDDVTAGTAWQSSAYTGTVDDGSGGTQSITFRLNYKVTQKDVTTVVNTVSYPNTIIVEERVDLQAAPGVWQDASSGLGYYKAYYTRNVGLIKYEYIDPAAAQSWKMELRRYEIKP